LGNLNKLMDISIQNQVVLAFLLMDGSLFSRPFFANNSCK
jgi:hypothetical protein